MKKNLEQVEVNDSVITDGIQNEVGMMTNSLLASFVEHNRIIFAKAVELDATLSPDELSPGIKTGFMATALTSFAFLIGYNIHDLPEYHEKMEKFESKMLENFSEIFGMNFGNEEVEAFLKYMKAMRMTGKDYMDYEGSAFVEGAAEHGIELPQLLKEAFRLRLGHMAKMSDQFHDMLQKQELADIINTPEVQAEINEMIGSAFVDGAFDEEDLTEASASEKKQSSKLMN